MFFFYALLLFAVAVSPTSAWASPPLEKQPGYIDFSSLDLFRWPRAGNLHRDLPERPAPRIGGCGYSL